MQAIESPCVPSIPSSVAMGNSCNAFIEYGVVMSERSIWNLVKKPTKCYNSPPTFQLEGIL